MSVIDMGVFLTLKQRQAGLGARRANQKSSFTSTSHMGKLRLLSGIWILDARTAFPSTLNRPVKGVKQCYVVFSADLKAALGLVRSSFKYLCLNLGVVA